MKTILENLYTPQQFADHIGATKQWVNFKIREAQNRRVSEITFYKNKDVNKPVEVNVLYSEGGKRVLLEVKGNEE